MEKYDIAIIGGGPGGYVAAIRAAQLGKKVVLIEKDNLGGICLNWGCIPTKALLKSAEVYHLAKNLQSYGISAKEVTFDFDAVIKRSRGVADQLSKGIAHLMKKNNITVIKGTACLKGKGKIEIVIPGLAQSASDAGATYINADHIIIATGARARVLPGMEPDGKRIMTYKEAMTPTFLPKKLLVVGSGAIGVEFASFYNAFGSDVTIVEVENRIMHVEDEEVSEFMKKSLSAKGIKIHTSTKLNTLSSKKDSVEASFTLDGKPQTQSFDAVIMAVGVVGNTENIGLENTAVKVDRGHIVTNEWNETAEKGVYAIGDVTKGPWLAHKASHEGVICVEKICGVKGVHPMKTHLIPGCTYSTPQVASVGLTEKAAKDKGYTLKVGKFPFIANGKAIALGETEGFVKTVFDAKTGELLGAHMVGAEVTEMIQGYVVAMNLESTEEDLMHTVFAHPTLSEMMHESVLSAFGRALHF